MYTYVQTATCPRGLDTGVAKDRQPHPVAKATVLNLLKEGGLEKNRWSVVTWLHLISPKTNAFFICGEVSPT